MSSEGRGSAGRAMVIFMVALGCLLIHSNRVHGATYTVGGSAGWTFNTVSWPKGKSLKAGDVLGKFYCHFLKKHDIHSNTMRLSFYQSWSFNILP